MSEKKPVKQNSSSETQQASASSQAGQAGSGLRQPTPIKIRPTSLAVKNLTPPVKEADKKVGEEKINEAKQQPPVKKAVKKAEKLAKTPEPEDAVKKQKPLVKKAVKPVNKEVSPAADKKAEPAKETVKKAPKVKKLKQTAGKAADKQTEEEVKKPVKKAEDSDKKAKQPVKKAREVKKTEEPVKKAAGEDDKKAQGSSRRQVPVKKAETGQAAEQERAVKKEVKKETKKSTASVKGDSGRVSGANEGDNCCHGNGNRTQQHSAVKPTAASLARDRQVAEDAAARHAAADADSQQYQTPLQRKEFEAKELRKRLHRAYQTIGEREDELEAGAELQSRQLAEAVRDQDVAIERLRETREEMTEKYTELIADCASSQRRIENLQSLILQMDRQKTEAESLHQARYLHMYRKGQQAAKFERLDELEKLAVQDPGKVSVEELEEKLVLTQQDLQKWQTLKLMETYSESEPTTTEADAKLRFLRDSMFHYLTDQDRQKGQQHLSAIIGIFDFTEVQLNNIGRSIDERKKKGKL